MGLKDGATGGLPHPEGGTSGGGVKRQGRNSVWDTLTFASSGTQGRGIQEKLDIGDKDVTEGQGWSL